MSLETLLPNLDTGRVLVSAVLLAGYFVVKFLLVRHVARHRTLSKEARRRWIVRVRSVLTLAVGVALVMTWAPHLKALSVSLLALAVAIVLAGKEVLVCLEGSLVRTRGQSFGVGDRIEVDGHRGYVIDQNLLTTTMLEIGPGKSGQMQTGHAITIPNSVFVSQIVKNESFMDEYMVHVFVVPMSMGDDWARARTALLEIASEECECYTENAQLHVHKLEREHGLDLPDIEPRVMISLPSPGRVDLSVRIPVPARSRGRIEQKILGRFLNEHAGLFCARPSMHAEDLAGRVA